MKNGEGLGGIESTKTLWDANEIERVYYNEDDEEVEPQNYRGDGKIVYERPFDPHADKDLRLKNDVEKLTGLRAEKEDALIFALSKLYGKHNGKYLSKALEKVEGDEYGYYNKQYGGRQTDGYDYLTYFEEHKSPEYDEEFYQFAQWYDYAFKRYAREVFLPEARRYETEYADKVRTMIAAGLLPESAAEKLTPIEAHGVKYSVVDAFNKQDIGGSCSNFDGDNPMIVYHIEFGLDEKTDLPSHYNTAATDFREVLAHELSHILIEGLFGVYGSRRDHIENRVKLSKHLPESSAETVIEADRIIVESVAEWLAGIITGETDESKADTNSGTYHAERQVADSLLNDGLEIIPARELFSLCAKSGEELEANRNKIINSLLQAYPDCRDWLGLASKICERFNWFEYLNPKRENDA